VAPRRSEREGLGRSAGPIPQAVGAIGGDHRSGSSRIRTFDYLRAIVIVLLLLHHGGIYRYSVLGVSLESFETLIEAFLLGAFVFLSGYLAAESFDRTARQDPGRFLQARFWRIYPPYLLALLLFGTIVGVTLDGSDWLAHVLGLQLPLVPAVDKVAKTVWYVGMIWVFFVLAAAALYVWRRPGSLLAGFAVTYAGGWFVHLRWGWLDTRLLYFFPVFALAIVIAKGKWLPKILEARFFHWEKMGLAGLAGLVLLAFPEASRFGTDDPLAVGAYTLFVMSACVLALAVLQPVAERRIGYRWVLILSLASFFIYLFHRPIWILVLALFPQETHAREFLVRMLVATPIVIVVSYFLQVAYDRLLGRWRGGSGSGASRLEST
jgi:peptidoglycan/LPS O-acetylase OafA/YrhL